MNDQLDDLDLELLPVIDRGYTFKSFLKAKPSEKNLNKVLNANDDDAASACIIETLIGFVCIGESLTLKDVFRHFSDPDERIDRFKKSEAYSMFIKNYLFDKNDRSTIIGKEIPDFDKLLALAAICRFVLKTHSGTLDNVISKIAYLEESGCSIHDLLEAVYHDIRSGKGIRVLHLADGRIQIDIKVLVDAIEPLKEGQTAH